MRVWFSVSAILLAVLAATILITLLPPNTVTLAAGPRGGAYDRMAQRYAEILARDGITVEIIHTNGSGDNLGLLTEGAAQVGFLQGGIAVPDQDIEAIAGIFFEPVVVLKRRDRPIPQNPALWSGLRISAGLPGSGTAAAFADLQRAVGLDPSDNIQVPHAYADAAQALATGAVDLAIFVTSIDAPYLIEAFSNPDLVHLPPAYIDAVSRRLTYASVVTLPAGAVSLDPVLPRTAQQVLALEARLVARSELHPAIVNRLTMAALELHASRDIITGRNTFPTIEGTDLRVNEVSRQLILEGPSVWHRWLPYWVAAQLSRLLLLTLPIFLILFPLIRTLPAIYAYVMGWRVWQYYPAIRQIDEALNHETDPERLAEMDRELVRIEAQIGHLRLPASYRQAAYDARLHIDLLRKRLHARHPGPPDATG